MRKHVVLIDYENVQPRTLELLAPECFHVRLFVGASQSKLPFEIAESMHRLGERAEYIKISGDGSNALDFHIAFYLGVVSQSDRNACFYIVSRDKGFDPLIEHLKSMGIAVERVTAIGAIPEVANVLDNPHELRFQTFAKKLAQPKFPRPRTLKTLSRSIASFYQNQLSEEEIDGIVRRLIEQQTITVDGDKIAYSALDERVRRVRRR